MPRASELSTLIPHVIAGDLDSIRPDVQDFFKQRGSRIIDLSHDQDTTDLQKCLSQLEEDFPAEDLADTTILAAGLPSHSLHVSNRLVSCHKTSCILHVSRPCQVSDCFLKQSALLCTRTVTLCAMRCPGLAAWSKTPLEALSACI